MLRVTNKYELERIQDWIIPHLKQYPSATDGIVSVYQHSKWPLFDEAGFCARVIRLAELLDRRDLDGIAALAYYALTTTNWSSQDQKAVYDGLSAGSIARLNAGRTALDTVKATLLTQVARHQCEVIDSNTAKSCAVRREEVLRRLATCYNLDFGGAFLIVRAQSARGACWTMRGPFQSAFESLSRLGAVGFGFTLS